MGRCKRGHHRPDIDNASALRPKVFQRFLRSQKQPKNIQIEDSVELLVRYLLERSELVDTSIVHQRIQPSKRLLPLAENLADVFLLRKIAMYRDSLAALGLD